ncbi:COBRA-like protein 6 [Primulina tabacum]|uniref:COBRA-like protein 6 n=1 Tax=Primulina tabacum TaxID=48773 RepID=UPI003F5A2555
MDWIPCPFTVKNRFLDLILVASLIFSTDLVSRTYGYDPLDPNGNITIRWDVILDSGDGKQYVHLWIVNFQLFRHVEFPGWKLSWEWPGDEVIWSIKGAEATEQGNCSAFKVSQPPHCCEKEPTIIDLLPGASYTNQAQNCCKGGVLSSMIQDPAKYIAGIQMEIGSSGTDGHVPQVPQNFSLGLPGYTCSSPVQVPPTKLFEDQGRRRKQAIATYNVTCSYSQFRAASAPTCCVSLSAFYNETIVPCPKCSCACQGQNVSSCLRPGDLPPVLQLQPNEQPRPVVKCSHDMCPIQVHWHVKQSYKQYWRVKITITNMNYVKNYSQWNLVVLHPNLKNVTQVFSFNYKPLNQYGNINDTGMFYGIDHYNDMLLQAGVKGNVQTEMLMYKDPEIFTFREGWAFPRKISFNGQDCVMPSPDDYPRLPNSSHFNAPLSTLLMAFSLLLFLLKI